MMQNKFNYSSIEELEADIQAKGYPINTSNDFDCFRKTFRIGNKTIPNALVVHPMEGGDAEEDGSPSHLTRRKYRRYAEGGAGVIWIEAVSVCQEGRSNPGQLMITKENLDSFKTLREEILQVAKEKNGHKPLLIVQLNHSGRYSKPNGKPEPIIATHRDELDKKIGITNTYPLIDDRYLDQLIDVYINGALLCKEAGFDGVDIKACHGYLLNELLAAYDRGGKYGGIFENRTALILAIIDELNKRVDSSDFLLSARINLYDSLPYLKGWGANQEAETYDLEEPIQLVKELVKRQVHLINITMGNPYHIPHVNRPFDRGNYEPPESPLEGVNRLIEAGAKLQQAVPEAFVVGVGYSWFRQFAPYVAAGTLNNGMAKLIGFGREGIAYPQFAKDLLERGSFNPQKVCISCSKCSEMKALIGICGCPVRDSQTYMPIYKRMREGRIHE